MAEPATEQRAGANVAEFTVSELAFAIKRVLEDGFGYVRLRAEISGFRGPHSSGHCYFALKDDKAKIEAVIWRVTYQRLRIKPEEGMEVIAQGRITTYPGSSKYQIVIEALEPAGLGALMALLEQRKRKLAAEGLFDEARKKKLPFLPTVVGIVTSPTGAVIRDMLHCFRERFPARVIVWPVRVQGDGSAAEVAAAIRGFNSIAPGGPIPRPDVLIVARGGGSLEDLWGFNEEIVARAAADSSIPLISAVGHETDWTLIDFVADARAPTPTKAAEWAVPKHAELAENSVKLGLRLSVAVRRALEGMRAHLKAAMRGLPWLEDLLALPRQRFDSMDRRLGRALLANARAHAMRHARLSARLQSRLLVTRLGGSRDRLETAGRRGLEGLARLAAQRRARLERATGRLSRQAIRARLSAGVDRLATLALRGEQALANRMAENRRRLDAVTQLLASLSYQRILQRGFALVRDAGGRTVRSVTMVSKGARLDIEVADGRFPADVSAAGSGRQPAPPGRLSAPEARPARSRSRDGGGQQGSLF
jgi:exodeoxyribonuclease VII large subunit